MEEEETVNRKRNPADKTYLVIKESNVGILQAKRAHFIEKYENQL